MIASQPTHLTYDVEELKWYMNYIKYDIKKSLEYCKEIEKIITPSKQSSNEEYMTFLLPEGLQGSIILNGTECAGSKLSVTRKDWVSKQENFFIVDCPLKQLYEIFYCIDSIENALKSLNSLNLEQIYKVLNIICDSIEKSINSLTIPPKLIFPDTPTHTFFQFPHPHMSAEIYIQNGEIILKIFLLDSIDSDHPSGVLADGLKLENKEITHKRRTLNAHLIESKYYWVRDEMEVHLESDNLEELLKIFDKLQQIWNVHNHNVQQFLI